MIVQSFAELQVVIGVGVDSRRALRRSLAAVTQANPSRLSFHFHLLLVSMSVRESQVDATFFVGHKAEFDVAEPLTKRMS